MPIVLTRRPSRRRVATDLGIGLSMLGEWVGQQQPPDQMAAPKADLARENEKLLLENRVFKEERNILKRLPNASRALCAILKPVTFSFVESLRHLWSVDPICRVIQISPRGYRCWRFRPISRWTQTDLKVLAHFREQYSLSLRSYGRPRMTMELKKACLNVGERRVGRFMTRRAA